jgi:release factor glutamine methyltransferase
MTEAELLFSEVLGCSRTDLCLHRQQALEKEQALFISAAFKRRIKGEPLAYILGKVEFMGLEFKVTPDVFIPRPETEILVEKIIELAAGCRLQAAGIHILEIGTGSGCIAVSLAKSLPGSRVTATDISEKALEVARDNAYRHKLDIEFIRGDLCAQAGTQDMIISNPPYIATGDIAALQPEIQYEPRLALDGGKDGLDFYRRLSQKAPQHLKRGGLFIMEIGFGQCAEIKKILHDSVKWDVIEVINDYNNIKRVIIAKRK